MTTLTLNKNTLAILSNFSQIRSEIVIRAGNSLFTVADSRSLIAQADVDIEFPFDVAIHDLPNFLSVLSVFKQPVLVFDSTNQRFITIKEANGKSKVEYQLSEPSLIKTGTKGIDPSIQFNNHIKLLANDLSTAIKMAALNNLTQFVISSVGQEVTLIARNETNVNRNTFNTSLEVVSKKPINDFQVVVDVTDVRFLPNDYIISFSDKISRFEAINDPKVTYHVALSKG